jgi:pimeloyl-ACP methyl ester carboxylesterase
MQWPGRGWLNTRSLEYPPMPTLLDPKRHTVTGEGCVSLNVWDYGGDGPNLLLCHCTGTFARTWDPVVRLLAGRFRCVALDTRGQGDSEAPVEREAYAWKTSGLDLLRVVDAMALGDGLTVVGHSAGGAHAGYAARARPGIFQQIVLLDAIIGPAMVFDSFDNPMPGRARRRVNVFKSQSHALERLGGKPPMNAWTTEALGLYIEHALRGREDGQCELKCPGDREAWYYELGGATDLFEELDQIAAPVSIVVGELSDTLALAQMQHDKLPNASMQVIPGCGHFVVQEKPEAVAEQLLGLL